MRHRRTRWATAWAMAALVALTTLGLAAPAQEGEDAAIPIPTPPPPVKGKSKPVRGKAKRGGLGIPAAAAAPKAAAGKKAADDVLDPAKGPDWPYHYKFKLASVEGAGLNATYYPARAGANAPVILLIHEKGGFAKDFQDPIDALKGQGLADALQDKGYAVLLVDYRSFGGNAAGARPERDGGADGTRPRDKDGDLQQSYRFLIDRHNRGELNLAKFAAVALGDGATLAARWAQSPDGAISSEGRISDLGALVLISPVAGAAGSPRLEATLAAVAPRLPLLLISGEKDAVSKDIIKASKPLVERQKLSKVVTYPTALHGARLLRFEPQAPEAILKFLEATVKARKDEWEPRYNLEPAEYADVTVVTPKDSGRKPAAAAAKAGAKAPPAEPAPPAAPANAPAAKPGRKKAAKGVEAPMEDAP